MNARKVRNRDRDKAPSHICIRVIEELCRFLRFRSFKTFSAPFFRVPIHLRLHLCDTFETSLPVSFLSGKRL